MKKMKITAIIMAVIVSICASGCGEEKIEMTDIAPKSVELKVWAWDETFNIKAIKMAAEKCHEKYPNLYVNVVTKEKNEILKKLTNDFSERVYEELPDIVLVEDYDIQKMLYTYEDEFFALEDVVDYSQFQEYKTRLVSKDGIHYGVPFDSGAAAMFYRKDYIEAAGYTEEDMQNLTWEKYIQIGKKVKEVTGVDMLTVQPDDMGIIRIMMQSGGNWYVDEDGESVNFVNNQSLKEAMKIYEQLLDENLALTVKGWDDFVDAFKSGEVTTVISGCWIAPTIRQSEEQEGLWRVAPIPRMEKDSNSVNASSIGGSSWYVLNKKENKEYAAKFLKETFGEDREFINELVKEINLLSTREDVAEIPAYSQGEEFFGEMNIFEVFLDVTEDVPVVNYGRDTYEIEEILEEEMQTFIKEKDLESSLGRMQMRAERLLD